MILAKSIFTGGLLVISFVGYGTLAIDQGSFLRGSFTPPVEEESQNRHLATCCPATGSTRKATSDCTQYSICQNGIVLATQPCPVGLLFDDTIQNCNWPNQVTCNGCGSNTGAASTSTPTPTVPTPTPTPTAPPTPNPTPTAPVTAPVSSTGGGATCGSGNRGNGICSGGLCCSQWGYCGSGPAYCKGSPVSAPVAAPVSSPTGGGSGYTIHSPSMTLSLTDVQAGVDEWSALVLGNATVSQGIVDQINQITANNNYDLYRQLAFVAHTIWESGAYQFTVEQNQSNWYKYQTCDWRTGSVATNGQLFYGRGYIQLSWCVNYKAYGQARMVNGDPDFFYNNPDVVAGKYAWDSADWVFQATVTDDSGQFGLTTQAINGNIECPGSTLAQNRYEIFDALAKQVGMTGYSSSGC